MAKRKRKQSSAKRSLTSLSKSVKTMSSGLKKQKSREDDFYGIRNGTRLPSRFKLPII